MNKEKDAYGKIVVEKINRGKITIKGKIEKQKEIGRKWKNRFKKWVWEDRFSKNKYRNK